MKFSRSAVVVVLLLSTVGLGCTMGTAAPDETGDLVKATEGLSISEETETILKGVFTHGDSLVTFEARLEAPMFKTKMVVNGAAYELERDLVKSTLTIQGHANTLLAADTEVLAKLEKAFDSAGNPTRMREALFKNFALMAGAPRGTTMTTKVIAARPKADADMQLDETNRANCINNEGEMYICAANTASTACGKVYGGSSGSNSIYNASGVTGAEGGTSVTGGYVTGCTTTPSYTHEHDACEATASSASESGQVSYHGRVTWTRRVGWSARACQGRCGAGCPRSFNFYITKDCLDHDVCLDNHPASSSTSTFGTCGNEFDQAAGDTTFGTTSGFTTACGFSMWGDNTR